MIEMDQKEQILHYHRVDGLSLREISRRVGLNRKTVTRYIRDYEASIRENPEEGLDICLASKPKYPARNVECTRMTEPVCAEIEYWLQENAKRRQTGMRKQCLKKQDIHRVFIEKGFNISYSSVCKYIQRRKTEKSKKPKDVFVKQYYEPGQECEFDWGEVKLRIGGKPVTFTMAVFALCHSEGRWAYLFRHQDNLAFMESHRNFFHDVHGVPHTMVYDNMKVAVILKPDGKKPTATLLRMRTFYGFDYRFCNARAGWEKGHVKRSVDYVRGRAFTTRVDFDYYIGTLMKKPGALKGSVALKQMPEKMQELFRVHFAENGKDFLKLLKYCRDNKYDYKDILDAVRKIRMRGARHINFDQIKVALETRDAAPLVFTESQKTDEFLEIELGSEDVLSQLDGIMQGTTAGRRCEP